MAGFDDLPTWGGNFADDDGDEDEGEYQTQTRWGSKDGLIFLIDCTESMFEKSEEQSNFELAIKCAKNVIQNKIISSDKDLMGIVFYGTEKESNSSDFKHIYVNFDLELPGAPRVLELEAFLEEPENNDFSSNYGHNDNYSLSEAMWTCQNMFSNCSQKIGYKRVLLFTNNDIPHSHNAALQRQAIKKAKDLAETGVELELMHMQNPGQTFDVTLFYRDLLIELDSEDTTVLPDPSQKFEELLTRVRSKDHKKRATGRIPLTLGEGMQLSVGVYNLVRTCTKPAAVKLYKKTNEEVKTVSKTVLTETAEVLMPQDLKVSQEYSGRKICFENEEVREMKNFGATGLHLMGFKPTSSLKRYLHTKPAQFIYPDESIIEGSITAFCALLKKCIEKDVIGLCKYIRSKSSTPVFVALLPQEEEFDENNVQVTPPGFHVIFLPFADDMRKVTHENTPRAKTDQVDKAKDLIKKLTRPFRSEDIENPALQTHYANLEALALDRDAPDSVQDLTLPDERGITKRAGKIIEEFKELVFPEGYTPGAKRKATPAGGAAKKAKAESQDIDIRKEAEDGKLGKLTVPVLKEAVKNLKIKTTGTKKADLIDAITDHFDL
ncbi:unnamed protein product [Owenia fusiformis]|uniref:DNA helicase n=1 Tax=Owenia fusiformis TaxID=6347 RepID=A0A8J1UDV3_OWEFU|nr:unnamed protein product [Owenia fusiformis]